MTTTAKTVHVLSNIVSLQKGNLHKTECLRPSKTAISLRFGLKKKNAISVWLTADVATLITAATELCFILSIYKVNLVLWHCDVKSHPYASITQDTDSDTSRLGKDQQANDQCQ